MLLVSPRKHSFRITDLLSSYFRYYVGVIAHEEVFRTLSRKGWDPIIVADRLALSLARVRFRLIAPLAVAAARFIEGQDWFSFGYARLEDHARERFGRSARWVHDLRALHEAISLCPALGRALTGEDGGKPLGVVAALLLARAATPETCDAWIELARRLTVRRLRQEVRQELSARWRKADPRADDSERPAATVPSEQDSLARDDEQISGPWWNPAMTTVRFLGPPAVQAAIDEARELHCAVCGGETTMIEFVEALIAEACAGDASHAANEGWIGARASQSIREILLERKAEEWSFLRDVRLEGEDLCEAVETLEKTARVCRQAQERSVPADATIRSLIQLENEIEMRIGELLALMGESGGWRGLRFSGAGHYAEERLGMSRSVAYMRCRLARAFRSREELRIACERGTLGLEAAGLTSRAMAMAEGNVSVSSACHAWVEHAEDCTVKRLRDELRLLVREHALNPASVSLAPPDDAGWQRSRYREAGEAVQRLEALAEAAWNSRTDRKPFHFRLPPELAEQLLAVIKSEQRRLQAMCRDLDGGTENGTSFQCSLLAARMFSNDGMDVPEWCAWLALLEGFIRTWDDPHGMPRRPADKIYARDGWRCSAPGCTSRRHLEEHHIVYRSQGGDDSLENRVTLCRFHHQEGEHAGLMRCRGRAPLGVLWSIGRHGIGGLYRNERRLDVRRAHRHRCGAGGMRRDTVGSEVA